MGRSRCTGRVVLGLIVALGPTFAAAHEHKSPSPPPSMPASTLAAEPTPATDEGPEAEEQRPVPAPVHVTLADAALDHLHNKVVHFPLALGFAGALLLLLSYRWPQLEPASRLLLLVAAASAVAAYFTGRAQEEEFERGALREYFERHEVMGKISGATLALTAGLSFVAKARPWLWLFALAVLAALSFTGLLGGILSHTPV
jgi:uncharacterized membrane protein